MASTSDSNKSGTLLDELRKNYEVSSRKGRMPKASFVIDFNEPVDNFTEELPGQGTVFRAFRHTERDPASRDLPPPTPKFAHESFLEAQNPSDPMAFHPPKLASKPEKTSGMSLMSSTVPTDAEIVGVTGLGHYVYTCWAKELGCLLRPDLLWFTICNEFAREVRLFPELYRSLLTDKPEGSAKEQLVVLVDTPEQLPMDELDALLESKIPTKELHDLIVKKRFGEFPQEEEFIEAMKITFANSCTPFYDFCTTLCGIPFVQIDGGEVDWKTLSSAIQDLDRILRPSCSAFGDYLSKCARIVDEIIRLGFVQPREALASGDQSQIAKAQKDAETFFSMMFWITSLCGSGHSYNCRGWVLDFYHRSMTAEKRIEYYKAKSKSNSKSKEEYWNLPIEVLPDLPSHVAFIPWRFLPTNRKFVKTTGIFYAVKSADKKFLVPQYGSNTYEIFDDAIFNKLAMTQSK